MVGMGRGMSDGEGGREGVALEEFFFLALDASQAEKKKKWKFAEFWASRHSPELFAAKQKTRFVESLSRAGGAFGEALRGFDSNAALSLSYLALSSCRWREAARPPRASRRRQETLGRAAVEAATAKASLGMALDWPLPAPRRGTLLDVGSGH